MRVVTDVHVEERAGDMAREMDGCSQRIPLVAPLPCGMASCGRPAYEALMEPFEGAPGAWTIVPICPACLERRRAACAADHGRAGEDSGPPARY